MTKLAGVLSDTQLAERERQVVSRWLPSLARLFHRDRQLALEGPLGEALRSFPLRGPAPDEAVEVADCRLSAVKAGPEVALGLVAECSLVNGDRRGGSEHLWLFPVPAEVATGVFLCGHDRLVVPPEVVASRIVKRVDGLVRQARYRQRTRPMAARDSVAALFASEGDGPALELRGRAPFKLSVRSAASLREALAMSGALDESLVDLDSDLGGEHTEGVAACKLAVGRGQRVSARECGRLAMALQDLVAGTRVLELGEGEEALLELLERFAAFCAQSAQDGGFTVH